MSEDTSFLNEVHELLREEPADPAPQPVPETGHTRGGSHVRPRKKLPRWVPALILLLFAVLCVLCWWKVCPVYRAELGTTGFTARMFTRNDDASARMLYLPDISPDTEHTYLAVVRCGVLPSPVLLVVRDTAAPAAEDAGACIRPGQVISAEEAVTDIRDVSPVTCSWSAAPDTESPGVQSCSVTLTDACGNSTVLAVTVTVSPVAETLTVEAGSPFPAVEEFLLVETDAAFGSGTDAVDLSVPGSYPLTVSAYGVDFETVLQIVDTTAPVLTAKSALVKAGSTIEADAMVSEYTDATEVRFSFEIAPDLSRTGTVTCTVIAEDAGGNRSRAEAELTVCDRILELEASAEDLTRSDLLTLLGCETAENREVIVPGDEVGLFSAEVELDGGTQLIGLSVSDTTAPFTEASETEWYLNYPVSAEKLIPDLSDATEVTGSFLQEPDWSSEEPQEISVLLKDASGNETRTTLTLTLVPDTEPPVIQSSLATHAFYVGASVSYFSEVSATDNADTNVTLTVDKSAVNPRQAGSYPVTYTATDAAGNTSTATVTFVFVEQTVTQEQVDELIQAVLAEIITDDMTLARKVEACYDYVRENLRYSSFGDNTDPLGEAYRFLTTRNGNCFTANATLQQFCNALGVETIMVERLGGATRHWWLLANVGNGWYHLDANNTGGSYYYRVLFATSRELYDFRVGYWKIDFDKYPIEVATEEFHDPEDPEDTEDWAHVRASAFAKN